jgi:hypothetical protein
MLQVKPTRQVESTCVDIAQQAELLRRAALDDMFDFIALPAETWGRRLIESMIWPPVKRFVRVVLAFDQQVAKLGGVEAARWFINQYADGLEIEGEENIPAEGPLVIASNHPGYFDGVAIACGLPRQDVKVIAGDYPLVRGTPTLHQYFIYAGEELTRRMLAIRDALRHLQNGGALLLFPSGTIDPDPAVMPGAEEALYQWSPSLELFLRKVPQVRILVTIVSGVISPASLRNPLTFLGRLPQEKQRIAEFIQICQQAFKPRKLGLFPYVSFGKPLTAADFERGTGCPGILQDILDSARKLLATHTDRQIT